MGTIAKVLIGGIVAFVLIGMEGSSVSRVLSGLVAISEAERDQPKDFQSFTPEQHYLAAVAICKVPPRPPNEYDFIDDCILDSSDDLSRVTRHLEAIPEDSSAYEDAARALQLVEIQRDRPQDFESARAADLQQCLDDPKKAIPKGVDGCGNALADMCNLFGVRQAKSRIILAKLREMPSATAP